MFRKIDKITRRKPPWLRPFLAKLDAVNCLWYFPGNCTKFSQHLFQNKFSRLISSSYRN